MKAKQCRVDMPCSEETADTAHEFARSLNRPRMGCYLYCFTLAQHALDLSGPMVDPRYGLRATWYGSIAAIWSHVGFDQFHLEKFEARAAAPQTIAAVAVRHDEVISRLMQTAPVLPLKLCTLFDREQHVGAFLSDHAQQIFEFLEKMRHQQEWGVKILLVPQRTARVQSEVEHRSVDARPTNHLSATRGAAALTTLGAGRRYFERKRQEHERREQAQAQAARRVAEVESTLRRFTPDVRPLPFRRNSRVQEHGDLVWNAACLLDTDRLNNLRCELSAVAERLQKEGFVVEMTGPWAPYNFCPSLDERSG